jgi:hypothetical protein
LVERYAASRDRIDRRGADRAISVTAEMVGAELIADDKQDVGACRHCAQFLGCAVYGLATVDRMLMQDATRPR